MRSFVLSLFLVACGTDGAGTDSGDTAADADTDPDPDPDTDTDTDTDTGGAPDGAALYAEHCAGCHGEDGTGTREGPDLTREIGRMTDEQIVQIILNGAGRDEMPAIEVTEAEAQAIVDFMRANF